MHHAHLPISPWWISPGEVEEGPEEAATQVQSPWPKNMENTGEQNMESCWKKWTMVTRYGKLKLGIVYQFTYMLVIYNNNNDNNNIIIIINSSNNNNNNNNNNNIYIYIYTLYKYVSFAKMSWVEPRIQRLRPPPRPWRKRLRDAADA